MKSTAISRLVACAVAFAALAGGYAGAAGRTMPKVSPQALIPTPPHRVDADTAVSPVYPINAKACRNHDGEGSEGEDFLRRCPGYDGYALRASGFDYRVNYGIKATAPDQDFSVMLFPLQEGPAERYARADLYDELLPEPVEWRLDARGKPYAVIVRAAFYRNPGSAKSFRKPGNRAAEFLLVRGLAGFEGLKVDVPTANTAYDPLAQARTIARQFFEQHQGRARR